MKTNYQMQITYIDNTGEGWGTSGETVEQEVEEMKKQLLSSQYDFIQCMGKYINKSVIKSIEITKYNI